MKSRKEYENRHREKQIKFYCSEEEAEQIKEKIEASGCTMREYMLQSSINAKVLDNSAVLEIMPELKRIGNNLNQIAKRCNEGGELARADEVELIKKELDKQWQLLRQLVVKQG